MQVFYYLLFGDPSNGFNTTVFDFDCTKTEYGFNTTVFDFDCTKTEYGFSICCGMIFCFVHIPLCLGQTSA
jgi:hypothetical protein